MVDTEPVNLLVVDDLPENVLVYRSILEGLGQNLITAGSGEEALKQVLRHEFAVILLDVSMPGMDGFETATLIRQRKKSARTPIIFLTAFTDEMRVTQGYASGAVDYLPTPVVPEILRTKVQVFIELFQMRRQAASQAEERAKRAAAEENARRSAFLAEAGDALTRSLDFATTLSTLARVAVPRLAELSVVRVAAEPGRPVGAEFIWVGPGGNGGVETEEGGSEERSQPASSSPPSPLPTPQSSLSECPLPWLAEAMERVLTNARYEILNDLPGPSGEPSGPCSGFAAGTALILPVSVRDKVHATLALVRRHSSPPYQPGDVSLAYELASRAGIALENTLLVQSIREADRRKDEFLAMLAHELRNPLGPIRNAVQVLQLLEPKDERMRRAREMINRQVTHMARLVDDLLDATRIARGKILLRKELCDLTRLVRQTAEDYRSVFEASGLRLEVHIPAGPLWVEGDPTRLAQAIGNLLHNAHKFTNPDGQVTVTVTVEAGGQRVAVCVRDTGVGIEPRILPHIFDVFRQAEQGLDRSRGGLGLGLALVKGLVELHGGEVHAVSAGTGRGASFTVRLPLSARPAVPPPGDGGDLAEGATYRILVIEDNQDAAESMRVLMSLEGHDVRTAYTGPEGLEVARTFRPQVILCDIGLPGMDGYQVTRAIRQDPVLGSTYVVAVTGYGRDEDQQQAQEAGFDLHLTKPVDYDKFRRALAGLPSRNRISCPPDTASS